MWSGRIGGLLILGAGGLFAIAAAIYLAGGGEDGLIVGASLALFGAGAAVLVVGGPRPLHGRLVRVGLAILALGQLSLLALSIVSSASLLDASAGTPPIVRALAWTAFPGSFLGALITGLALLRTPGPSRAVGAGFVAAMTLLGLSEVFPGLQIDLPPHTLFGVLALAVLANIGVGVLALIGSRAPAAVEQPSDA